MESKPLYYLSINLAQDRFVRALPDHHDGDARQGARQEVRAQQPWFHRQGCEEFSQHRSNVEQRGCVKPAP